MMEMPNICAVQGHDGHWLLWLLGTWNEASVIKVPDFRFYLILINVHLNISSHMWLPTAIPDSTGV